MKQSLTSLHQKKPGYQMHAFPPTSPEHFLSKLSAADRTLQNYKIIAWEKNFQYSKIHIADLESIFVKDNQFFKEMVTLIEVYNIEVEKFHSFGSPIQNGPWRSTFFVKLHNILLEIVFTKNRTLQNYFIETVHSWTMDQLSRLNGQDSSSMQGSTQRPLTGSTAVTRPLSGVPQNKEPVKKTMRPGSAIIPQGAIRPVSAMDLNERPVSGVPQGQENEPGGGIYKYIRPLSGWNRPLSSITRPWSSTSAEIYEANQEFEEQNEMADEEEEQEKIHEVGEEEELGEEEEEENEEEVLPDENQQLPSQYIKNVMRDYKIGARTKIDYVDPPYERIKFYRHKNLLKETILNKPQSLSENPVSQPEIILYDKPILFLQQQQKYHEQKEEERKQQEALKAAAEAEKKLKGDLEEPEEAQPKKTAGFMKPAKKKRPRKKKKEYPFKASLVPEHIPYRDDDLFKCPRGVTAQSHIRNKFETKSTFLHYQPSDDPRELNMELKWFYNRNKELNDKRLDEEMVTMLKEWGSNKERIEAEISRKVQSEYDASQFQKIEYKPDLNQASKINVNFNEEEEDDEDEEEEEQEEERRRPASSVFPRSHNLMGNAAKQVQKEVVLYDFNGLESIKNKRKVDEVRKLLGPNIGANGKDEEERPKIPKSLSIYSTQHSSNPRKTRPFSAFIQGQKLGPARNEQMFEINEIRDKMAKHRLPVNTKVLVNALMVPEGLNNQTAFNKLPLPGSDLIKNPFTEVKKKGKKKGKGKGKGKKKKK